MTLRAAREAAERADRERERRELTDAVGVARMIHGELARAMEVIGSAVNSNSFDFRHIPLLASETQGAPLARTLPPDEWMQVSQGIAAAGRYARESQLIMQDTVRLEQQHAEERAASGAPSVPCRHPTARRVQSRGRDGLDAQWAARL